MASTHNIPNTPIFRKKDEKIFNEFCKNNNNEYTPIILPTKRHVFAIGDLHGDYKLTLNILIDVIKVIDKNFNWILPNTYVVQVGDQLDNCRPNGKSCKHMQETDSEYSDSNVAEDIKILELFTELDVKAREHDSRVISLFGNHELMNVQGYMDYVSYSDIIKFSNNAPGVDRYKDGKQNRKEQFKPGNKYANFMACTRIPVVIIGNFMFVHAGIIKPFIDKLNIENADDLYKISYLIRKWLLKSINKNNVIDIMTSPPHSMFWDRILGSIPHNAHIDDPICDENLKQVLELFKMDKMIIGHTPQCFANGHKGINSTCSGKLWRIDFGGSFSFNKADEYYSISENSSDIHTSREPQVLYIKYNHDGDKEEVCVKVLKKGGTLVCDK
jgi:hypothetical protein